MAPGWPGGTCGILAYPEHMHGCECVNAARRHECGTAATRIRRAGLVTETGVKTEGTVNTWLNVKTPRSVNTAPGVNTEIAVSGQVFRAAVSLSRSWA